MPGLAFPVNIHSLKDDTISMGQVWSIDGYLKLFIVSRFINISMDMISTENFLRILFLPKKFLSKFNPQKIFSQNNILEIFTEKVSCHTNIHRRCSFKIIPLFWKNIFCGYCNDRKLSLWIFWGYYFDRKFSVRYWKNIKYKDIF